MQRKSSLALTLLAILPLVLCSTLVQAQSGTKSETGSQSKMDSQQKMSPSQESSPLVMVTSQKSFDETYEALKQAIESKDLKVIAEIDHAENAESTDMKLLPTKVILFGNPKMGTPLMKAKQSMALDLPQRMAVYEDAQGEVHIVYNNPQVTAKKHQLEGQDEIIKKTSAALKMLANKAAGGGVQ
ncbi:DUF302 domain-containing protein [bacterium]|nr:DUF302 domain-containing protein [bacterium]